MPLLELRNVSKSYGSGARRVDVLRNVNLAVEEGEFVAILGFSGSGKTTLMSLINGLLSPDRGNVLLNGNPVTGPGPDRGVVFQNYSLLPWLSARQNVALAVDHLFGEWPAERRREHVDRHLAMVNLSHALDKRPGELSGGMRQRVSVARALAMNPKVLLMDEPLSALDALTRATLQIEIERIWEADRKTVILVTNDIDEAILLADRIVPLTPAPCAMLGPDFVVDLPRPRERVAFNRNETYRRLRNDITRYFLDLKSSSCGFSASEFPLPDLMPVSLGDGR